MSRVSQLLHHLVARPGAQQPDRAGDVRQLVGEHVLAQQRLGDAGAEQLRYLLELGPGAARAGAGQDGHLAARVQELGRADDRFVVRERR